MISNERIRSVLASRVSVSCAAVLICLVGAVLRLQLAAQDLAEPFIDENEVVEQAVAFMGGELQYFFLKYGPLTMYALAAVYHLVAAVRGMSAMEYASRVFFEGSEHYFIARAFVVATLVAVTWLAFASFRRQFGPAPALLVCCLLGLPGFDVLYQGVRIDVVQGVLQCAVLLILTEVVVRPRRRDWVIAGMCAGLAIATKPLPGLLVLPCFALASWFSASRASDGSERIGLARLGATLREPGLWLAALACVCCAFLANPSMLDIEKFVSSQQSAIDVHSSAYEVRRRMTVMQAISGLGLPFLITSALALVTGALRRDPRSLIVTLFLFLYLAAFWGRAARNYFMVAPAMAACLLVAYTFANLYHQLEGRHSGRWLTWLAIPCVALLMLEPAAQFWKSANLPPRNAEARAWFYEHVPSGTPLVYVGARALGLVSTDQKLQGRWGDHFDRGRKKYKFYKRAFSKAFSDYLASEKPRYPLVLHDARLHKADLPRSVSRSLLRKAQAGGQRYIVLFGFRGDVFELGYPWFGQAILEKQTTAFAIFRVPAPEPIAEAPSASAPPSGL